MTYHSVRGDNLGKGTFRMYPSLRVPTIVITYPSRDGMLWDSGHATAVKDRETYTVLDDIGESSDNKLEGDADADLENQ